MVEVLFSHSYFLRFDPKQWRASEPYAPLGTIYAAAWLRQHGYSVALHDVMFAHQADEVIPLLEKEKPSYFILYDDGFNYLTKMCLTNMRHAAWEMAAHAQKAGAKVIVCSSDSTDRYEMYLDHHCDFVALGEGEETVLELVNALKAGATDFQNIAGIAFRQEGKIIKTPARAVMRDLDALPMPAWDLVNIEPYKAAWQSTHGYFAMNMTTTRGCPYKCNWCAKPIYGNRYNVHDPVSKANELKWLNDKFKPDYIWFCDDIFGLKPGWVKAYADELQRIGLKIPFKIQSRVDLLLKEDTIADLARAGCDTVWLGAESGSQKILDAMDKGTTVEQIAEARRKLKAAGIRAAFFIQFGYLGEVREDIDATFRMIADLMPDDIGVSVSYPLPGTGFYEKVKEDLVAKTNWADSDDLALMFRNNQSAEFYKRLHRFVHKYFRKLQGLESLGRVTRSPFRSGKENWRRAFSSFYYVPAAFFDRRKLKSLEVQ
jgi:anaerobic magnesium-protoporphyrin IX monomethyl ester cyclase